jgi:hypothetical protein
MSNVARQLPAAEKIAAKIELAGPEFGCFCNYH